MRSASLFILDPPYVMARRMQAEEPALGAVALYDAVIDRPTTNDVKGQMELAPWCPLCLLADMDSGMRSTRRLPRTCVVFGLDEADGASAILKAVSARPRPTPSDMVDWIVRRTHLPSLSRMLSDLFTRPSLSKSEVAYLPFAVKEQLRLLGEWGPIEWQRAIQLADLAADRSLLNRIMAADSPGAGEMRHWITELLGLTERQFHDRYGWEWVLEASLRRAGFFEQTVRGVRPLHSRTAVVPSAEVWGAKGKGTFVARRATA
jgi:hypothetical protein